MLKKVLTLCLLKQDDKILLGMKKRGFGMGKWNGFGGKVNQGEAIEDAAKRELLEESGLVCDAMEKVGILDFSWNHEPKAIWQVHIFRVNNFSGKAQETEEMKPQWFNINEMPFEKMWADDKHWFPLFLENKKFSGRFLFDKDNNILDLELRNDF